MKPYPIYDKVIIKPDKEATEVNGIIIPDSAVEKPQRGVVVSVGKGKLDESTITFFPLEVKEGDIVYYIKNRGVEIEINVEKHLIIKEEHILFYQRPE
jgi:chaperonin GroES